MTKTQEMLRYIVRLHRGVSKKLTTKYKLQLMPWPVFHIKISFISSWKSTFRRVRSKI